MGGHGGLNILPQKRWNVYNYDNREKVKRDEEAAAREEQLKQEQSRKRDAEFRLEQLRSARGLAPLIRGEEQSQSDPTSDHINVQSEPTPGHINLFEGIKIFDPIKVLENEGPEDRDGSKKKKMKKEEVISKVITAEDEKYRLGYGLAGKGVKLPWYLQKPSEDDDGKSEEGNGLSRGGKGEGKKSGKKTLEELREERLRREKKEKERERALIMEKSRRDGGFSRSRPQSRR